MNSRQLPQFLEHASPSGSESIVFPVVGTTVSTNLSMDRFPAGGQQFNSPVGCVSHGHGLPD